MYSRRHGGPAPLVVTAGFLIACISVVAVTSAYGVEQPHAELVASPLGCPACHDWTAPLAPIPGEPSASMGPADDSGCVLCHVEPGGSAPGVYGGDEAHYRAADGFGHNGGEVSCTSCHTIHGPALENPNGLSGMLLKQLDYQAEAVADCDPGSGTHDMALSVWCTGCHKEWPGGREPVAAANGAIPADAYEAWVSVHRFGLADGGIAWRDCTSCLSCHAAGRPGEFPHYTPGADAGLLGAGAQGVDTGTPDRGSDAVCLRCHRHVENGVLAGVGEDY